jgi:hypothetical protein
MAWSLRARRSSVGSDSGADEDRKQIAEDGQRVDRYDRIGGERHGRTAFA